MALYFIREEGTNLYKIGVSAAPEKRAGQLQTGNPRPLILWGYVEELDYTTETKLHELLADRRAAGEWFDLDEWEVWLILKMARADYIAPVDPPDLPVMVQSIVQACERAGSSEVWDWFGYSPRHEP